MKLPVLSWLLSLPAAIFYCFAALAMHVALNSPNGVPAYAALLSQFLLHSSIALWVLADARQRGRPLPYDTGTFFFFAWPALAPIYLFSTRGWRAIAALGWFVLLYLAAALFGGIPYFLSALRQ